jgi:asparagine synthase (glutamine-hydrolysing)
VSGIAVLLQRDGAPADAGVLRRMLARLSHRGEDGENVLVAGSLALGHCRFRTTPEEVGEQQPLADQTGRYSLAMDGRLDNREELVRAMGLSVGGGATLSDAALLVHVFARWGHTGFARVVGSFAVAIWDASEQRLTLARDALGDRTLCYAVTSNAFVAASEEQAVLAHSSVDDRLDERRVAQFFAVGELDGDATFFAAVKEVLPGHAVVVDGEQCAVKRYWQAPQGEMLRLRGDREYGEAYRAVLFEAVRAQLRSTGPVSLMLSGGLDSSSIGAIAASISAAPVKAVSWVFDELPSCDERTWIEPVVRRCGLEPVPVPGDGEWPFRDFALWRHNPNSPEEDLYRRLTGRACATARAAGCRVVLSGMFGDHLYSSTQGWLWERLSSGSPAAALADSWRELRQRGLGAVFRGALWPVRVPDGLRKLAGPAARQRPWLTDHAKHLLADEAPWPPLVGRPLRPRHYRALLGLATAHGISCETFHAAAHGVELRYPCRDRRVVEFILRLPVEQLYRPGTTRPVLREAMRGLLPEEVRMRVGKTSLQALFQRGACERETESIRNALVSGQDAWREFVRREWVAAGALGRRVSEIEDVGLWQCLCFARWLDRRGSGVLKAAGTFRGGTREPL